MTKKTLVFGASMKPHRYSNIAIKRLKDNAIEVVAFGMKEGLVHGVPITSDLSSFEDIHTVTLYMNPQRQEAYYNDIIALQPKRVIFNPGTENPDFYVLLEAEAIHVEVACTLVMLATRQY